jgi:hypothetical protein
VIVYSHSLTPRLQYVVNFLGDYFQRPFKLTANEQLYLASEDFKINYSHQHISPGEVYINPHALLFETEKRKVQVKSFQHNGYTAFFETSGDLHFDLFAGIFFLISRYEEYLPHQKDQFGLYSYQNSAAHKEEFLHQPLVNIWLEDFRKFLKQKFEGLEFPENKFRFLPTYDIDIAWAYKNKSSKIHTGSVVRSILQGKFKEARQRIRVVKGKQQDPYDAYEWLDELHQKFNLDPIYFFLVAEEKGKYDKNIDIHNHEFQQLVKSIASKYKTGIHPSWCSGDHKAQLPKEKKWLETVTHHTIHDSRQHYLRFHLPSTFEKLIDIGIRHEYSMGYGQTNGFRASIATPFLWYDLAKEQVTNLMIHPFCFMDANSYFEQGLTAEQAYDELIGYYNSIKAVNGTMITLWHNTFLGPAGEETGWRGTYERFVETVNSGS